MCSPVGALIRGSMVAAGEGETCVTLSPHVGFLAGVPGDQAPEGGRHCLVTLLPSLPPGPLASGNRGKVVVDTEGRKPLRGRKD